MDLSLSIRGVADQVESLESALVSMVIIAAARYFEISPKEVKKCTRGGVGEALSTKKKARDCAIAMLVTGAEWSRPRAGKCFGISKQSAWASVERATDLRDKNPDLDFWMEMTEAALSGRIE